MSIYIFIHMEDNTTNLFDLIYTNDKSISPELCSEMIRLFENEDNCYDGLTSMGMNKTIKDTTDFTITDGGVAWERFNTTLSRELNRNVKTYVDDCNSKIDDLFYKLVSQKFIFTNSMQLQKYNKNIGKYAYHNDFSCNFEKKSVRVITFMWYLNDVEEGGETEFWSKYMIKPKAGTLVLFPASWTFPHRAKTPISSDKYIITGWLWKQY